MLGYFGTESAGSLVLLDPEQPASTRHGLQPLPLAGEADALIGDIEAQRGQLPQRESRSQGSSELHGQ
jgi:hypothetical protein